MAHGLSQNPCTPQRTFSLVLLSSKQYRPTHHILKNYINNNVKPINGLPYAAIRAVRLLCDECWYGFSPSPPHFPSELIVWICLPLRKYFNRFESDFMGSVSGGRPHTFLIKPARRSRFSAVPQTLLHYLPIFLNIIFHPPYSCAFIPLFSPRKIMARRLSVENLARRILLRCFFYAGAMQVDLKFCEGASLFFQFSYSQPYDIYCFILFALDCCVSSSAM